MKKILMSIGSLAMACGLAFGITACADDGGITEYAINVAGGGSSVGISQAQDGTVELGMASSKVEGEDAEGIEVYAICQDGIAIVVHNDNALDNLTIEQLNDIYTVRSPIGAKSRARP